MGTNNDRLAKTNKNKGPNRAIAFKCLSIYSQQTIAEIHEVLAMPPTRLSLTPCCLLINL